METQAEQIVEDEFEGPVTPEELSEYRRIRPLLLQMIEDWQKLKGPRGCPAMHHVLRE